MWCLSSSCQFPRPIEGEACSFMSLLLYHRNDLDHFFLFSFILVVIVYFFIYRLQTIRQAPNYSKAHGCPMCSVSLSQARLHRRVKCLVRRGKIMRLPLKLRLLFDFFSFIFLLFLLNLVVCGGCHAIMRFLRRILHHTTSILCSFRYHFGMCGHHVNFVFFFFFFFLSNETKNH